MNAADSFFVVARRWMRMARQLKQRGDLRNAAFLAREAREYVRVGRCWRIMSGERSEPYPLLRPSTIVRMFHGRSQ